MRKEFVARVFQNMVANGGVEKILLERLEVVSAVKNKVIARMPIEKKHTNRLGILHGGVLATLTDVGGSLALASNGMFMTGVSTDLSATYIGSGGKPGEELEIHCHCQKLGRSMAYTFMEFYNQKNELVARGNHTKYIAPAWKSDKNVDPVELEGTNETPRV